MKWLESRQELSQYLVMHVLFMGLGLCRIDSWTCVLLSILCFSSQNKQHNNKWLKSSCLHSRIYSIVNLSIYESPSINEPNYRTCLHQHISKNYITSVTQTLILPFFHSLFSFPERNIMSDIDVDVETITGMCRDCCYRLLILWFWLFE